MARKLLLIAAFVVLVVSVGTALALPWYTCREGWHTIPAAVLRGHPTPRNAPDVACARAAGTGGRVVAAYYPDSRMLLKAGIGVGGAVAAAVLALVAARPRRVPCG